TAVTYALNRKEHMMTYLEDGRCSLSNNLSEQKMKSYVIGRKG
ncbi:MAG: transposase, partial [Clostridium sp.]|nr:transposase [Clostridium sp.]